jgi:hypothetical protein
MLFFWAVLIIAIQILSCQFYALTSIFLTVNAVYGLSGRCVVESANAAKTLRIYYDFQLVKLVNLSMLWLFCHSIKWGRAAEGWFYLKCMSQSDE